MKSQFPQQQQAAWLHSNCIWSSADVFFWNVLQSKWYEYVIHVNIWLIAGWEMPGLSLVSLWNVPTAKNQRIGDLNWLMSHSSFPQSIFRFTLIHYISAVAPVCTVWATKSVITLSIMLILTISGIGAPYNQFTHDDAFLTLKVIYRQCQECVRKYAPIMLKINGINHILCI